MDETPLLKLPYILAAQSQKHVTHNEALRALDAIVQLAVEDKDLSAPPGSPAEGARYIVSASPTGAWAGHAKHVAAWQDGAWAFHTPVAGWVAWVHDESEPYIFTGGGWIPAPGGGGGSGIVPKGAWSSAATYATGDLVEHEGHAFLSNIDDNLDNEPDADTPASTAEWTYFAIITGGGGGGGGGEGDVNPVSLVGVNATANTTNRLSVSSPASLFSHEGSDHRLKINKAAAGNTASVLFQTGFTGHAEFGLAGDNDWHVKVSPDGSAWHEAIVVDRSTGAVSMPNTPGHTRQVFTSSGTWTKPAGCRKIKVWCQGGGGSGASPAAVGSQCSIGRPGGGGGLAIKWIDVTSISSVSVTVGTGGSAPGTADTAGNAGGQSSFGAHCSANGGTGGSVFAAGTAMGAAAPETNTGATASGGDINIVGKAGSISLRVGAGGGWAGEGGHSLFGTGGSFRQNNQDGVGASGYGAGGSGGIANSTTERYGGAGTGGIVVVEEFY